MRSVPLRFTGVTGSCITVMSDAVSAITDHCDLPTGGVEIYLRGDPDPFRVFADHEEVVEVLKDLALGVPLEISEVITFKPRKATVK